MKLNLTNVPAPSTMEKTDLSPYEMLTMKDGMAASKEMVNILFGKQHVANGIGFLKDRSVQGMSDNGETDDFVDGNKGSTIS